LFFYISNLGIINIGLVNW